MNVYKLRPRLFIIIFGLVFFSCNKNQALKLDSIDNDDVLLSLKSTSEIIADAKLGESVRDQMPNDLTTEISGPAFIKSSVQNENIFIQFETKKLKLSLPQAFIVPGKKAVKISPFWIKKNKQTNLFSIFVEDDASLSQFERWVSSNMSKWIARSFITVMESENKNFKCKIENDVKVCNLQSDLEKSKLEVLNNNFQLNQQILSSQNGQFRTKTNNNIIFNFNASEKSKSDFALPEVATWESLEQTPMTEKAKEEIERYQISNISFSEILKEFKTNSASASSFKKLIYFLKYEPSSLGQISESIKKNQIRDENISRVFQSLDLSKNFDAQSFLIEMALSQKILRGESHKINLINTLGFSSVVSSQKNDFFFNKFDKFELAKIQNSRINYVFWLLAGHYLRSHSTSLEQVAKPFISKLKDETLIAIKNKDELVLAKLLSIWGNCANPTFLELVNKIISANFSDNLMKEVIYAMRFQQQPLSKETLSKIIKSRPDLERYVSEIQSDQPVKLTP